MSCRFEECLNEDVDILRTASGLDIYLYVNVYVTDYIIKTTSYNDCYHEGKQILQTCGAQEGLWREW